MCDPMCAKNYVKLFVKSGVGKIYARCTCYVSIAKKINFWASKLFLSYPGLHFFYMQLEMLAVMDCLVVVSHVLCWEINLGIYNTSSKIAFHVCAFGVNNYQYYVKQ